MRIKKIKYKDHNILGNLELDFTNKNGEAEDMILIAGENGCGKTTIINDIFDIFSGIGVNGSGFCSYYFGLNDEDLEFLKKNAHVYFSGLLSRELIINKNTDLKRYSFSMFDNKIDNEHNSYSSSPIRIFKVN